MRMESLFLNSHVKMFEEKTPLSHKVVCFQMLDFETSYVKLSGLEINSNILLRNYFFLKNVISEGAVSRL